MKRRALWLMAIAISASASMPARANQDGPLTPLQEPSAEAVAVNESTGLWFIELAGAPAVEGRSVPAIRQEKQNFRGAAAAARVRYTERRAFDVLFNGFSVAMAPGDVAKVARMPEVRAIYPVVTVALPPADEVPLLPELQTALAMTGADVAQSELGLTGRGIRVAIMDTGVDYHHPDLGGCFGPGCRVEVGWDFVGNAFNGGNTPVPGPDPDDCNGHGTHVAGIVGAKGEVKGVAPEVTFAAYKVFGCAGSTQADIMLAAMERALADGAHILNISIGAAFQWPQYPTAVAATRLVNRGMVVVASIGNSGANGVYSASAPGVGEKVIGVASFLNTHLNLTAFTISPDDRQIGYGLATGAPPPPVSGTYPMSRTGSVASTADACVPLEPDSLAGTVALVRRGTCSFFLKALHAQQAGAAGVVLYNNVAGLISPTVEGAPPITIPVVAITADDGAIIDARLAQGDVDLTWTDGVRSTPNPGGGLTDAGSSYGVAPNLLLKPDVGAPGGNIRSTYPLELGGYNTISGTSMAAPHVAGAVALLLEARPNTPAQAVAGLLQNTAVPRPWRGSPGLGFLDQVHRQGAGLMRIDSAITATARVEPSALSLGEGESGPQTRTLRVRNQGTAAVTYALSHAGALATGPSPADPTGTFTPGAYASFAGVGFSVPVVTVPAGGAATVEVTIAPPATPFRGLYGGYILLTPQGGGPGSRVPYAGFVGDYQGFPVLTPTVNQFPWLARLEDESFGRQEDGAIFTMQGDDVPFFLLHLDHQVRRLRLQVFDAVTGRSWHRALEVEYVGRNSTPGGFFAIDWDGLTLNGRRLTEVPNGSYVIEISVQKALGDDGNPEHWESWTSPLFVIARP